MVQHIIEKELLDRHGIRNTGKVPYNTPVSALYEEAVKRGEGEIAEGGTLVAYTAPHTGRSPQDRFIVMEPSSEEEILSGPVNKSISPANFDSLYKKVTDYFQGRTSS